MKSIPFLTLLVLSLIVAVSCSSGRSTGPLAPETNPDFPNTGHGSLTSETEGTGKTLLGYWQVNFDLETLEFAVTPLRTTAYHANIAWATILPGIGNFVSFKLNSVDVSQRLLDFDVTIEYPNIPGKFPVYDTRGILMCNGLGQSHLTYPYGPGPVLCYMNRNEFDLVNADGHTRWYNPEEFSYTSGEGLFGFVSRPVTYASSMPDALLNHYKYFSNDLDSTMDVAPSVPDGGTGACQFEEDPTLLTRNYVIRYPVINDIPQVGFYYAIDTNLLTHCDEPFHIEADFSQSTVWYQDSENYGGDILGTIEVFDWGFAGTDKQIELIYIVSPTLLSQEDYNRWHVSLSPLPGSSPYSRTYLVKYEGATPSGITDQEILIEIKSANGQYKPENTDNNPAYPSQTLASYKIVNFKVHTSEPSFGGVEVITPNGAEAWEGGTSKVIKWEADDSIENVKLEISKDGGENFDYTIIDSTLNDGMYIWNPVYGYLASEYCVLKISDTEMPLFNDVSDDFFVIQNTIDSDDDGIPNYLEYYGYTVDNILGTYSLWDGDPGTYYAFTDPNQASTDQDPFIDSMEFSGLMMDPSVTFPADHPMIPAYPIIHAVVEGYQYIVTDTITLEESKTITQSEYQTRSTTESRSQASATTKSSAASGGFNLDFSGIAKGLFGAVAGIGTGGIADVVKEWHFRIRNF